MNDITIFEDKFTRCPQCRSFSVKKTELTVKETIKAYIVPVTAQQCANCGYRFVEYGGISSTLKTIFISIINCFRNKWLLVTIPLLLLGIIIVALTLPWGGSSVSVKDNLSVHPVKPNHQPLSAKPSHSLTPSDQKETQSPIQTPVTTVPQTSQTPVLNGTIELGNQNRFGVNWVSVENGVKIRRLANGPLKEAGLVVGDVITAIDNNTSIDGNLLEALRNEIFTGKRSEAFLKVVRGETTMLFKFVKKKSQTGEQTVLPSPSSSSIPSQPQAVPQKSSESDSMTASPGVVKVSNATILMVRKSSPETTSHANRWRFLQKTVSIKRTMQQEVYVAGNSEGTALWGVDDTLVINGQSFPGYVENAPMSAGTFPDSAKHKPLNITHLVPAGQVTLLHIQLTDSGQLWGNTAIYIVVK